MAAPPLAGESCAALALPHADACGLYLHQDAATASGRAGFLPEVPPSSLIRLQSLLSSALPRDDAAVHDAVMAMDNGFSGKLSLILLTLPRLGRCVLRDRASGWSLAYVFAWFYRLTDALAMLVNLDLSLVMPFAQHQCTEASRLLHLSVCCWVADSSVLVVVRLRTGLHCSISRCGG